ncbi:hypothetical protein PL81_19825 [Streptomyces sp. RSD-27]|nr:hypothetical protein PL81_19825 [Streptomyces sp. RSD-27]
MSAASVRVTRPLLRQEASVMAVNRASRVTVRVRPAGDLRMACWAVRTRGTIPERSTKRRARVNSAGLTVWRRTCGCASQAGSLAWQRGVGGWWRSGITASP